MPRGSSLARLPAVSGTLAMGRTGPFLSEIAPANPTRPGRMVARPGHVTGLSHLVGRHRIGPRAEDISRFGSNLAAFFVYKRAGAACVLGKSCYQTDMRSRCFAAFGPDDTGGGQQ